MEGEEGTGDNGAGESKRTGEKVGENGGDVGAGGEVGSGVRAGAGEEGSVVGGGTGVVTVRGDGSGFNGLAGLSTSFSSLSFSSFLFEGDKGGTSTWEFGNPTPLWVGEDLTGLDGVGLGRRLGITWKEFLDCRRRLARARACRSPSGILERSGFGEGRISKSGVERDTFETGLEGDTARAKMVSGEHGTLGLGGTSVPSQSLSLVGFV